MRLSRCISTETEASIVKGHDMTTPSEDYRLIPLTQGQFAKVDSADYDWISQWKWFARWCTCTKGFYAARTAARKSGEKWNPIIHMHREVIRATPGFDADHINLDTLDNRRSNLRLATRAQNSWNRSRRSDNTSGYKGVSFRPEMGLWRSRIMANGKRITLGYFPSAYDAHLAYCTAAAELHGEFARTA